MALRLTSNAKSKLSIQQPIQNIPNDLTIAGDLTVNDGADTTLLVGRITNAPTYNGVSLNGTLNDTLMMGIEGGASGDNVMYILSPGSFSFFTQGSEKLIIADTGQVRSGDPSSEVQGSYNYGAINSHGAQCFLGYTNSANGTGGGSICGYFVADATSGAAGSTGAYIEARISTNDGALGAEIDVQNTSGIDPRNTNPNSLFGSGAAPVCYAIWSQPDGTKTVATPKDASAFMGITGNSTSGNKFLKGIVFGATALRAVGGHTEAIALPASNEITWYSSGGAINRLSGDGTTLTSDKAFSATSLQSSTVAVSALPAAASGNKGMRMMVSDATATTFWSIVAGLGANIVPVTSDGTNWRIG